VFNTLTEILTSWAHLTGPRGKDKKLEPANFTKKVLYKLHLLFLDPPILPSIKLVPADGDELRQGG
jgi:hypothetical protein